MVSDSVPQFIAYYDVSYPNLRQLAAGVSGRQVFIAGEAAGLIVAYYFPNSKSVSTRDSDVMLHAISERVPLPDVVVLSTMMCPNGQLSGLEPRGYKGVGRLQSWRNVFPVTKERGACFVIYGR
jgi:hypothetical protein